MPLRILVFILLVHSISMGQTPEMPFELERYAAEIYARSVRPGPFEHEIDALETYISEYKRQRADNPANYFPPSTLPRKNAAAFIQSHFQQGESMALIHFLETEGSKEACIDLITAEGSLPHVLPYQFLAAYLLNNDVREKQALMEMNQRGMLSEFLVAFGQNMINSARDSDAIVTNGFQDLIAVRAAQLIRKSNPKIPVYNIFAERCKAFAGTTAASVLADSQKHVWVSPVMSVDFLSRYENELYISGIGYMYSADLSNPDFPVAGLLSVADRFDMPVVNMSSLNPSLKGLAKAYKPFMKSLDAHGSGNARDRKKAREIAEYLAPYWR